MSPVFSDSAIILRRPHRRDCLSWITLRENNRFFLQPWEPKWEHDSPSKKAFKRQLSFFNKSWKKDSSHSFFLLRKSDQALMGGITLGHIRFGVSKQATTGYWLGREFARRGYMTRALYLICLHGFENLGLCRIEACPMPDNIASIRLLEKSGFSREGLAREFLEINGVREDHLVFSLLKHEFTRREEFF